MLTPRDFDVISKQASKLYSQLELEIIEEIARRIANVGYANTVVRNDVLIAQEMGMLYQDAINIVAKYNNQSYEEIQGIFETAGIKTLKFDDKIYKEAGLNPVPIKQSRSIMQLIASTTEKTNYNLNNLVMTTADSSQTEFYNAINRAYMEVSTGVKSYSTAIIDTIKEVSRQGAIVTYPSGYKTSIENATRMNVITGVNQTCGKLQELRADELGWDLMELTAHPGARPEHAEWQGKIVSRSGKNKKYLTLEDIGYGTATGFKGVNCRHDWCPYYEGLSRTYIQEMLDEYNNATVKYNGEEIPLYDATQMQRKIERQIRQDKKDIAGVQGILESSKDEKLLEEARNNLTDLQIKQKLHNSTFNEFLNQTGLQKENYRLKVGKINVTNSNNSSIIKENKITLENLPNELGINLDTYNPFDNNVQEKVAK